MNKKEKTFDAVMFVREQRNRLAAMFSQMTTEEIVAFLKKTQMESTLRPLA